MGVDVHVSAVIRNRCGGQSNFTVEGKSIREVAEVIDHEYPGFAESVLQMDGAIQTGILVSINGEMVTASSDGEITLQPGDKVFFLSALAGG